MRNYEEIMKECMRELDNIGIQYSPNITGISINNRLSRALGRCAKRNGNFRIELAGKVAKDDVDLKFIKDVLMHELVHTIPGCFNHGPAFHSIATCINRRLGYHVVTKMNTEDLIAANVKIKDERKNAKYALVCQKCGTYIYRQRWSDALANPSGYIHAHCGGKLKTISLDPKIAIATTFGK